jgi:PLP dependent protein
MMTSIAQNLQQVLQRIRQFEQRYDRDAGSVRLIAVSKTHSLEKILDALSAGQHDFGENYAQETIDKIQALSDQALSDRALCWHFIGPLQSNKTRQIAEHVDWVHSVDREKIAVRLSEQRPSHLPPLNILLQVNISGEDSKSGIDLAGLPALAAAVAELPALSLKGLMAIPAPATDFDRQRQVFRILADARDDLLARGHPQCRELSMGMSQDFEAAIAEGATMVRIGTDIFGRRQ